MDEGEAGMGEAEAEAGRRSRRGRLSTNLEPHKPTTLSKTVIWIFPE